MFVKKRIIDLLNILKKNVKSSVINSLNDLSTLSINDITFIFKNIKKKKNITENLKVLILNMKENLEKTENFITIIIIFILNQIINLYSKLFN